MTMQELKQYVEEAADAKNDVWVRLCSSNNPKDLAEARKAEIQQEVLEAVLAAIAGNAEPLLSL